MLNTLCIIKPILTITFILLSIFTFCKTEKGKKILFFAKRLKIEINKIHCPNAKETFFTTIIIVITTSIISLILWGVDSILFRIISLITNIGS